MSAVCCLLLPTSITKQCACYCLLLLLPIMTRRVLCLQVRSPAHLCLLKLCNHVSRCLPACCSRGAGPAREKGVQVGHLHNKHTTSTQGGKRSSPHKEAVTRVSQGPGRGVPRYKLRQQQGDPVTQPPRLPLRLLRLLMLVLQCRGPAPSTLLKGGGAPVFWNSPSPGEGPFLAWPHQRLRLRRQLPLRWVAARHGGVRLGQHAALAAAMYMQSGGSSRVSACSVMDRPWVHSHLGTLTSRSCSCVFEAPPRSWFTRAPTALDDPAPSEPVHMSEPVTRVRKAMLLLCCCCGAAADVPRREIAACAAAET